MLSTRRTTVRSCKDIADTIKLQNDEKAVNDYLTLAFTLGTCGSVGKYSFTLTPIYSQYLTHCEETAKWQAYLPLTVMCVHYISLVLHTPIKL